MTQYLNPSDMPKEQWLLKHAELIGEDAPETRTKEEHTLAVLVSNGAFNAVALVENDRDFVNFQSPEDTRPKLWWWVHDNLKGAFR